MFTYTIILFDWHVLLFTEHGIQCDRLAIFPRDLVCIA